MTLTLAMPGSMQASAAGGFTVLDDFSEGATVISACGNSTFVYKVGTSMVGGRREARARDGHSCVLGGRAHLDIVTTGAGYLDTYGATANEETIQYGMFIGTVGEPWSPSPNAANAVQLNLTVAPADDFQFDVLHVATGGSFLQIKLLSSAFPYPFQRNVTFTTAGTQLVSLSTGWTDPWGAAMPASALNDVDGLFLATAGNTGNTPGSGLRIDRWGIKPAVVDTDGDGVNDPSDQCPGTPVGEPADAQGCSASQRDGDGDGASDAIDQCPGTASGATTDARGCSGAQNVAAACSSTGTYRNHGAYVSCVSKEAEAQVTQGLLTDAEKDAIVSTAAQSSVGKK